MEVATVEAEKAAGVGHMVDSLALTEVVVCKHQLALHHSLQLVSESQLMVDKPKWE